MRLELPTSLSLGHISRDGGILYMFCFCLPFGLIMNACLLSNGDEFNYSQIVLTSGSWWIRHLQYPGNTLKLSGEASGERGNKKNLGGGSQSSIYISRRALTCFILQTLQTLNRRKQNAEFSLPPRSRQTGRNGPRILRSCCSLTTL